MLEIAKGRSRNRIEVSEFRAKEGLNLEDTFFASLASSMLHHERWRDNPLKKEMWKSDFLGGFSMSRSINKIAF